ncbi:MAG TPA: FAD-dependent oxidoreductase, partial [Thermoanaerobaculia bacterium]|nr:FAD-dependent oxidoreductase [Thermoanaerobaculia bacterium]
MRLLLVGAGHAHLEILRRLAEERPAGVELTLLSPEPRQVYSGMVPGYLAGTYALDEISVPVEPLAARAGGRLAEGRATALDPERRIVRLKDSRELPYDLASFAVGSNTAGIDRSGVAEHAVPIKPLGRVVELREKIESLAREPEAERTAAVVGGGAAGTEVALALRAALGPGAKIHLLEAGSRVLSEYPERFRERALAALAGKGIEVLAGTPVARVGPHSATLEDGREIPAALTIWLAGAVGWPLFRDSGLPLDDRGFLLLDDSLRSVADPKIFA